MVQEVLKVVLVLISVYNQVLPGSGGAVFTWTGSYLIWI